MRKKDIYQIICILAFLLVASSVSALDLPVIDNLNSPDSNDVANSCYICENSGFGGPRNCSMLIHPNETALLERMEIALAFVGVGKDDPHMDIYTVRGDKLPDEKYCDFGEVANAGIAANPSISHHNFSGSCLLNADTYYAIVLSDGGGNCDSGYMRLVLNTDYQWNNTVWYREAGGVYTVNTHYGAFKGFGESVDAPAGNTINITFLEPRNGSAYNLLNFTEGNFFINISQNDTYESCQINDSIWAYNDSSADEVYFVNSTPFDNGNYTVEVICNRTVGAELRNGSATAYFKVDTVSPTIQASHELGDNLTVLIYNDTLFATINFTDNILLWSINLTWENGSSFMDPIDLGTDQYSINISNSTGENTFFDCEVCDPHTKTKIREFPRIDIDEGLKYVYKDNPLWDPDEYIHVLPKTPSLYSKAETKYKGDRYTFSFHKIDPTLGSETFVVYSTQKLNIVNNSVYIGNLVTNGYWIDFQNPDVTSYEIVRIDQHTIEITLHGLVGKNFKFESVGGLNCVTERFWFGKADVQQYDEGVVLSGDDATFNLTFNYDHPFMTDVNATLYWNYTHYTFPNGTGNFSQTVTTPYPIAGNSTLIPFNWTINIDGVDYDLGADNLTVNTFAIDNCTVYKALGFWFNVYDEETNTKISVNGSWFYDYWHYGFSSTTKTYGVDMVINESFKFCKLNESNNITSDFSATFKKEGYGTRTVYGYSQNMTGNFSVYLLQETGTSTYITFSIITSGGNPVEDANMKIYRTISGTPTLIYEQNSDVNGQVLAFLDQTVVYSFIIEADGYPIKTMDLQPISTSYQIILSAGGDVVVENTYRDLRYKFKFNGIDNLPRLINISETFQNITFIVEGSELQQIGMNITSHDYECIPATCEQNLVSSNGGNVTIRIKVNETGMFNVESFFVRIGGEKIYTNGNWIKGINEIITDQDLLALIEEVKDNTSMATRSTFVAIIQLLFIGIASALGLIGLALLIPATLVIVFFSLPQVAFIHPLLGGMLVTFGFAAYILGTVGGQK